MKDWKLCQKPPVIFLAFANPWDGNSACLRNLPEEQRQIRGHLAMAENAGLCEIVERSNATIQEIFDVFQDVKYRDRIAIFHYGGHANGYELLLESDKGESATASSEGLVPFLAGQPALKLVFLNGCSTEQHALDLIQAGIPTVVGTSQQIADDVARNLAIRFYNGIANDCSLEQAWKEAVAEIKANKWKPKPDFRDLYCTGMKMDLDRFPWDIYYKEGAENVKNWNLPDAANDPLSGLPKIPGKYTFPDEPYLFLRSYERKHSKVFFGRSYYIRNLYNMVKAAKSSDAESPGIILLYGQSGVGKSSLLDAGLIPRLESSYNVIYTRRNREKELLGTLNDALQNLPAAIAKSSDVEKFKIPVEIPGKCKWKWLEEKTGKSLVIILDQVEEMYTHPNKPNENEKPQRTEEISPTTITHPNKPNENENKPNENEERPREFEAFLSALVEIFKDPGARPKGKLILGYRKEYHPEIWEEFKRKELPRSPLFIDRLDQRDISEVVTGLTSTTALHYHYYLEIQEGLAEQISFDLSADTNSPVAPVLQIILTKMWEKTVPDDEGTRTFTKNLYNSLQKKGILMGDFFKQQMEKLQTSHKEEVESGLALDILKFHTTELGTSAVRSIAEIKDTYSHSKGTSQKITDKMRDLFLLTLLTDPNKSGTMTSLAHDTLAPIVIKEYNDSDKPGQRAARILATKMKEFKKNPTTTWLGEAELEIVENGQKGMRALEKDEKFLLALSRTKVLHTKKISTGFKASQLTSIAQSEVTKNPTIALRVAEEAYKLSKDKNVIQNIHKIYRENIFYKIVLQPENPITALALSPDRKYILIGFKNGAILLWDSKGKKVQAFKAKGHRMAVNSIAFSRDGKLILTGSTDKTCRLWDRQDGKELHSFKDHKKAVNIVGFSRDNNYILTGSRDGITRIWDLHKKDIQFSIKQKKEINYAAFSHDDRYILTLSNSKSLRLWDCSSSSGSSGSKSYVFKGHKRVTSVTFSPDGKYILTGAKDGTAYLWDLKGNKKQVFKIHKKGGIKRDITAVSFCPGDNLILTGSMDGIVRLWDLQGKELQVFKGHTNAVTFMACLEGGRFILTGSQDQTIRSWDLQGNKFGIFQDHKKAVNAVAISQKSKYILTGSNDKIAILWNRKGKRIQDFSGHGNCVTCVAISANRKWVLTGSLDRTARLWDPETGKVITIFGDHTRAVTSAAFSRDNKHIVTGSSDKTAILWNRDGRKIQDFIGHTCGITAVTFSPDKKYVLTGSRDKTARLWSLSGEKLIEFTGHKDYLTAVAFSPDSKYILTGSRDETARLWDLKGNLIKIFDGHNESVNSVAFSHGSGEYILTGSRDNLAILWDRNGNWIQDFIGHKDSITSVTFSPDNKFILTGSKDKAARKWQIKAPLEKFLNGGNFEKLSEAQEREFGIEN